MKTALGLMFLAVSLSVLGEKNSNELPLTLEVESLSNGFSLHSISKDENESFVFDAFLNFESGQAGGLVFGAKENEHYFVFNMDRYENKVKLLYFSYDEGTLKTEELLSDYFIGNDKMTSSEKNMVEPKLRTLDQVNLKVVLTYQSEKTYVEFFADGIKRFGVDSTYDLNSLKGGVTYKGGQLGANVFAGKINLSEIAIGQSDYSYYSELYRNQYHFSQYAHWNNDPNGLVYYEGYYHVYFQTHPFSKYWSDMYWGHARSKDLLHWENLPICLFPDDGSMGVGNGDGYMWSGTSIVYHKGDSSLIDEQNWFGESSAGLIAFLARDGSGSQDQLIVSSDDGGMSWSKRSIIPQSIIGITDRKVDFRDPKVFPVSKDGEKVIRWGMGVTGMAQNTVYFLESTDLLNWKYSSSFEFYKPECFDIFNLSYGDETKDIITLSGRDYLVGNISYTDKIVFKDFDGVDISTIPSSEIKSSMMDYGPDSYATQSFFIDDENSEYYGKSVSVSWFSGVPGDARSVDSGSFGAVRHPWNGGGMTIPVSYSLDKEGNEYRLKETPITLNNENLKKTNIVSENSLSFDPKTSENPLKDVNSHVIEISASISNPNSESISFKIDLSSKEYLEIGWNLNDGYYVDRSNLGSAGISFSNYKVKYSSKIIGDKEKQTFYILSDNGGVELFANDFKTPFYVLTLASPYSTKADFSSTGEIVFEQLEVNEISSTYRDNTISDEGIMYLSETNLDLDLGLHKKETLRAYCSTNEDVDFEIVEGEGVLALEKDGNEATISAKAEGKASIKAFVGNIEKICEVTVHSSSSLAIPFSQEGIIAGDFYQDGEAIVAKNKDGDGYLLSSMKTSSFLYGAKIDLSNATAGALIINASEDLSRYICINYDKSLKACKVWSNKRQLAYYNVDVIDLSNVNISVQSEENSLIVYLDGKKIIDTQMDDDEKEEGYLGLNVFKGEAIFSSLSFSNLDFEYTGGDFNIEGISISSLKSVTNITNKNSDIPLAYCSLENGKVTIKEQYFATLREKKTYRISLNGYSDSYEIKVDVKEIPLIELKNREIEEEENLVYFIGSRSIDKIELNGKTLDNTQYQIKDYCLTIYANNFQVGENILKIDDEEVTIKVIGEEAKEESAMNLTIKNDDKEIDTSKILYWIITIPSIILIAVLLMVSKNKEAKK